MPERDQSRSTAATQGILQRISGLQDYYRENPEKPFGTERVSKGEARKRFTAMSLDEKQDISDRVGSRAIFELLRKRGQA
tara:strand:- start:562 stop:801 length:240 start_codon:yes stop_codon:yes gene_type:complete